MAISNQIDSFIPISRNLILPWTACLVVKNVRDLSSSLAAFAALSNPVGSKLLHLSLGLSPPPLPPDPPDPPSGAKGVPSSGGGDCEPLPHPKSQDMVAPSSRALPGVQVCAAYPTKQALLSIYTRAPLLDSTQAQKEVGGRMGASHGKAGSRASGLHKAQTTECLCKYSMKDTTRACWCPVLCFP